MKMITISVLASIMGEFHDIVVLKNVNCYLVPFLRVQIQYVLYENTRIILAHRRFLPKKSCCKQRLWIILPRIWSSYRTQPCNSHESMEFVDTGRKEKWQVRWQSPYHTTLRREDRHIVIQHTHMALMERTVTFTTITQRTQSLTQQLMSEQTVQRRLPTVECPLSIYYFENV